MALFGLACSDGSVGPRGPTGPAGPVGAAGTACTVDDNDAGTKTISCADGTMVSVTDGAGGGGCSVIANTDGTKTITCGDGSSVIVNNGLPGGSCTIAPNGDGTSTITCAGTSVVVANGAAGTPGEPCTVTPGTGSSTITCGTTTITISDGQAGTSVGTIDVQVEDAVTRADLIGAVVIATPGDHRVITDEAGRATFADLPFGVYTVTAMSTGLKLVGSEMIETLPEVAGSVSLSLVAGASVRLVLRLTRFERETLNLVALHLDTHASFTNDNCLTCHTDRQGELSADPAISPWHATGGHAVFLCVNCHSTVDLLEYSGVTVRKQVSATSGTSRCKNCHPSYPMSY